MTLAVKVNRSAVWHPPSPWRVLFNRRAEGSLVEAAGVEPASEAAFPGISTSVSRILVLAWRLLLTGSASASRG